MTNEQSAAYYGNLARVAAGFAISCDSDTEALAAYLYAVQAARYARYASLFTSPMKPATICPICHARTSTPATLPDGSAVCQLCGENAASAALSLASTFGPEWDALTDSDRALIVRDCTTPFNAPEPTIAESGTFAEYRRNIGPGNLGRYALTQRIRFRRVDSRHD